MADYCTIGETRHHIVRDAHHEAESILTLLRERLAGGENSVDNWLLIRGLVHRLTTINDVVFDAVLDLEKAQSDEELAARLGTDLFLASQ